MYGISLSSYFEEQMPQSTYFYVVKFQIINLMAIKSKDNDYTLPPQSSNFYLLNVFKSKDTEFPGVVARPIGEFKSSSDYQYQLLRCNVDLLKIIQLGLTFYNEDGEQPAEGSTWQFNFKFNLT